MYQKLYANFSLCYLFPPRYNSYWLANINNDGVNINHNNWSDDANKVKMSLFTLTGLSLLTECILCKRNMAWMHA